MYSPIAGKGQVIAIEVSLPKCQTKSAKFPYLNEIPEELNIDSDGRKVNHDRFGEGVIFAYVIAFKNMIISLSWEEVNKIAIWYIEKGCENMRGKTIIDKYGKEVKADADQIDLLR